MEPESHEARDHAELKSAIDADDVDRVIRLMTENPRLHQAPLGYGGNGPLTWVAECRGTTATPERLAMAAWMLAHGSDIHQGGDGPLMRACLSDHRIPMIELLIRHGADVHALWNGSYPIIFAPCETLQPGALRCLLDHGADLRVHDPDGQDCLSLLIGTYSRHAAGKRGCLEILEHHGFSFPQTAPMAIHRGRADLLRARIDDDPSLVHRCFRLADLFPGTGGGDGLHVAPLEGTTLLHLAVEFQEIDAVRVLLEYGADVNARADTGLEGFTGHSPLFHTTVTLSLRADDQLAALLLANGADPELRATIRKQLEGMGDGPEGQLREYRNVTAVEFAEQFPVPAWVNREAVATIRSFVRNR